MSRPSFSTVGGGLCLAVVAVGVLAAQPASPAAPSNPTAADMIAALVTRDEMRAVLGDSYWAYFPQVTTAAMYSRKAPGLRLLAVRRFDHVVSDANALVPDHVESTLTVYASAAAAAADYRALASSRDAPSTLVAGPTVGEESRWFERPDPDDERLSELTARFRAGRLVGRVSVHVRKAAADRVSAMETVARLAIPSAARAARVSAGDLREQPPASVASRLLRSVPASLRQLVALAEPPTAWAVLDSSGDPIGVEQQLRRGGVKQLAFAAYGLKADPRLSVEVVLFPFASAVAADRWVDGFRVDMQEDRTASRLDPGRTGPSSVFARTEWGYEMQFTAGLFAADVSCLANFYETSNACVAPMRTLAERWYAQLSR